MNHLVKKAAIAKYGPLHQQGFPVEQVKKAIGNDEKAFTPDEVNEIYEAITAGVTAETKAAPPAPAPAKKEEVDDNIDDEPGQESADLGYIVCEEWKGEYEDGKWQPLKKQRDNVKLPPDVFERMNSLTNELNPIAYIEKK